MIYPKMMQEHHRLQEKITRLKGQLHCLPKGNLLCTQNGAYSKWYVCKDGNRTYLPKSKRKLAEQLALRKYLSCQLKDAQNEEQAINAYLCRHTKNTQEDELWNGNPEYGNLLLSFFSPQDRDLSEWAKAPYQHNEVHPEQKNINPVPAMWCVQNQSY